VRVSGEAVRCGRYEPAATYSAAPGWVFASGGGGHLHQASQPHQVVCSGHQIPGEVHPRQPVPPLAEEELRDDPCIN
jgi:hypothetical protein